MGKEKQIHASQMVSDLKKKRGANAYRKGVWAEFLCALLLRLKGYHIVRKRYKTKVGEIDLIAIKGNHVVFVEVKARGTLDAAGSAISETQKVRLKRAASSYLASKPSFINHVARFDVMLVVPWHFPVHYVNAFY